MKAISSSIFMLLFWVSAAFAQMPDGLQVGADAPVFSGVNQNGETINSQDLLKTGEILLVFYRGNWCPYCQKHLSSLQEEMDRLREQGVHVVVVSPEGAESVEKTVKKTGATYAVLQDPDYKIMKDYDVAYQISKETVPKYYNMLSKRLAKSDNNTDGILPVPATYIIDQQGKISYVQFDVDYSQRSDITTLFR